MFDDCGDARERLQVVRRVFPGQTDACQARMLVRSSPHTQVVILDILLRNRLEEPMSLGLARVKWTQGRWV